MTVQHFDDPPVLHGHAGAGDWRRIDTIDQVCIGQDKPHREMTSRIMYQPRDGRPLQLWHCIALAATSVRLMLKALGVFELPGYRAQVCAASMTSCVWVTTATKRPFSEVMRVCQTMVRRPRCGGRHSPMTFVPEGAGARKFVLDSTVVVWAPSGRFSVVAQAPSV